jgi:ABC-type Co2+ transport system permease subunit
MHVPDGFIDAPVSLAAGAIAVAGVGVCLRGARRELDDRTSGHLLGGALAATLVGPYTGALCISVVLFVQALFADGGLTALGVNVTTMALVGVVTGYVVLRLLLAVLPKERWAVVAASAAGALVSVPAAALAFVGFFAVGGTADVAIGTVVSAMVSVHVLIGIGEAVITGATVASVLAVRPDLVRAARGVRAPLERRPSPVSV